MNHAILLSGGVGSRLKADIPKQYLRLGGMMIITRTSAELLKNELIDSIWIVADVSWQEEILSDVKCVLSADIGDEKRKELMGKVAGFSNPGRNRQLSIYNAMSDMADRVSEDDVVLVQDAVRPLATQETIVDCLTKIEGYDGALPVLPMKDTVYLSENGKSISSLLDRSQVYAGQAPEAYRYGKYRRANEALFPDEILKINGAAEPAIMAGMDVAMIEGDEGNFKITTRQDLERYRELVDL